MTLDQERDVRDAMVPHLEAIKALIKGRTTRAAAEAFIGRMTSEFWTPAVGGFHLLQGSEDIMITPKRTTRPTTKQRKHSAKSQGPTR